MKPTKVDALNGYALVASSIMGFLPPVFTLMLLHSHGAKSWFSTALVLGSWCLNSITFFILVGHLSSVKGDSDLLGVGLQSLFHTTSCGGSSAMALCHQLTGAEPLVYLDRFFNKNPIPNIKNVPMLWAFTTVVLFILVTRQIYQSWADNHGGSAQAVNKPGLTALAQHKSLASSVARFFDGVAARFALLLLSTSIFCFALGYEFLVVREYQKMDIIDKKGWSFGQVVAVLFWIPPLLDTAHTLFKSSRTEETGESGESVNGQMEDKTERHRRGQSRDDREPLAYAQLPAQNNTSPTAQAAYTGYSPNPTDSWSDGEHLVTSNHVQPGAGLTAVRAITRRPVPSYRQVDHGHNEQV